MTNDTIVIDKAKFIKIVKLLKNPYYDSEENRNALWEFIVDALKAKEFTLCEEIFKIVDVNIQQDFHHEDTILTLLIKQGACDVEILEFLKKFGLDVNKKDICHSPLQVAIYQSKHNGQKKKSLECAKWLLANGAKIEKGKSLSYGFDDTIGVCISYGTCEILKELLKYVDKLPVYIRDEDNLIIRALPYPDKLDLILQKGLSPNFFDQSGKSPLYRAMIDGNAKTVKILLKHKANPQMGRKAQEEIAKPKKKTIKEIIEPKELAKWLLENDDEKPSYKDKKEWENDIHQIITMLEQSKN